MKSLKLTLLLAFAAITLFTSCDNGTEDPYNYVPKHKVLILNQGNYTSQDASIYLYDEDNKTLLPNVYEAANSGAKLGATIMSGTFTSAGAVYVICANPDKIVTLDALNMKAIGTVVSDGVNNPREAVTGGDYLFVTNAGSERTDLGNGYYEYTKSYVAIYDISVIIPRYIQSVEVGSDAQGLIYFDNTLYVATKDGMVTLEREGSKFVKMDTFQDETYTGAVKYLCLTQNKIYVSVPGFGVYEYDPYDRKVLKRFNNLPLDYDGYITSDPQGFVYSRATIYDNSWNVESSGAYRLNPANASIATVFEGDNIYGVGASNYSGNIYVSDAKGFTGNSAMSIINSQTLSEIGTETTGIGTFRYLFYSYLEATDKN